jgi:methyltransferase (TIGR00027 family)
MRARLPSQTAAIVAMLRALADRGFTAVEHFEDPVVRRLLPPLWSGILTVAERAFAGMRPEVRARVIDQLDMIARRVRAIDLELEAALRAGVRQVVILGAGLDTRAFRMRALADTDVFEVDHPATQAFKARKASALPVFANTLHYVPLDFERDTLTVKLCAAGHRSTQPTVWIWEGVVMYLTDAALAETLRALAALSAPQSKLIVQYHEPEERHGIWAWTGWFTRGVGEPQIGLRTRAQMAEALENAGFRGLRDDLVDERHRVSRVLVAELADPNRTVTVTR